jgi:hypothetical protein
MDFPVNSTIDAKTVRLIHVVLSPLGLSDEVYRGVLERRYSAASSKDLTQAQGDDLVHYLRRLTRHKSSSKLSCDLCMPREKGTSVPADAVYPVSPEQLSMIDRLSAAIKWKRPDGFERWLLRYFGLTDVEWSREASVVINALKRLLKSQHRCGACARSLEKNGGKNDR